MTKLPETELAKPVIVWMADLGWDIYQEVAAVEGVADIVGTRGPLIWVVECKTSLTLKVIAQAHRWLEYAHYVSVAVPNQRGGDYMLRHFADRVLRDYGIGKFEVYSWPGGSQAKEDLSPELRRVVDADPIRRVLCEQQKTASEAGSAGGGYWTPFKCTCDALREFVGAHPGCSLKAAIDGIKHHYATPASARGSLRNWIAAGKVPGVVLDETDRQTALRLGGNA